MKKHELLKYAYDNYPKGTIAKALGVYKEFECSGIYIVDYYGVKCEETGWFIYNQSGNWAEIVKPQIAIKVENEKEFHALMKYYESNGRQWNGGSKPTDKTHLPKYPNNIGFENYFQHTIEQLDDFKVIPFSDFSKEHNIKLPLIKSEDGIWLYEGDECFYTYTENGKLRGPIHYTLKDKYYMKHYLFFRTKQAALDWIEAQKPKLKELDLGDGLKVIIGKSESIMFNRQESSLSKKDIMLIYNAIQELS